jgi:hypothetical protein
MQGRMGRIGIEEESENELLLFALQTLALPPDHLKDSLGDGMKEGGNDSVLRQIRIRIATIPASCLSLSLQKFESFDKLILCLGGPTTGSLPFIEANGNYI